MLSQELSPAIKNGETQNKNILKSPGKCHHESKSYLAAAAVSHRRHAPRQRGREAERQQGWNHGGQNTQLMRCSRVIKLQHSQGSFPGYKHLTQCADIKPVVCSGPNWIRMFFSVFINLVQSKIFQQTLARLLPHLFWIFIKGWFLIFWWLLDRYSRDKIRPKYPLV